MYATSRIVTITDEESHDVYDVEVSYKVVVDPAYGADADGNRGERRTELEVLSMRDFTPPRTLPGWVMDAAERELGKLFERGEL